MSYVEYCAEVTATVSARSPTGLPSVRGGVYLHSDNDWAEANLFTLVLKANSSAANEMTEVDFRGDPDNQVAISTTYSASWTELRSERSIMDRFHS